jgi:ABC-type nitrate/sulfonate/bicarbonate transport system substrate-binding protein
VRCSRVRTRWRSLEKTANPVYSLIVKPQIQHFAELKGKTLGLSLPVDTISISIRKLLALKGLGEADYSVKELVGTPVRFDCLKRGECDAVPLGQPEDFVAMGEGYRRLGVSTEAVAAFQFQVVAARRAWAQENRDTVVRLCALSPRGFASYATPPIARR